MQSQRQCGYDVWGHDVNDVLIISSCIVTMSAVEAAKALEADRVDVAALHVPTIKPLHTETIIREAKADRPYGSRR